MQVLGMLGLPKSDMALLAESPDGARIHVLPMGLQLQPEALAQKIARSKRWTHVMAFRPTGMHMSCHGSLALLSHLLQLRPW